MCLNEALQTQQIIVDMLFYWAVPKFIYIQAQRMKMDL